MQVSEGGASEGWASEGSMEGATNNATLDEQGDIDSIIDGLATGSRSPKPV